MEKVLSAAAGVSTPIGLLGLIAAIAFFVYSRRARREERRLEALPPEQRAAFEEEWLKKHGFDAKTLTRAQKYEMFRTEQRRRFWLPMGLAILSALVFVTCFAIAVFAPDRRATGGASTTGSEKGGNGTDPPKRARFRATLAESNLVFRGKADVAPEKEFEADSVDAAAGQIAGWVKAALVARYPRTAPTLSVTASARIDRNGDDHQVSLEPPAGKARTDRLWVFTGAGKVHVPLQLAPEASQVAITAALKGARAEADKAEAGAGRFVEVQQVYLHSEQPGYDLLFFPLPLDGTRVTRTAAKLTVHPFTVVIDREKDQDDHVSGAVESELKKAEVSAGGVRFWKTLRDKYEESQQRQGGPSPATEAWRMSPLREARVDAFLILRDAP